MTCVVQILFNHQCHLSASQQNLGLKIGLKPTSNFTSRLVGPINHRLVDQSKRTRCLNSSMKSICYIFHFTQYLTKKWEVFVKEKQYIHSIWVHYSPSSHRRASQMVQMQLVYSVISTQSKLILKICFLQTIQIWKATM